VHRRAALDDDAGFSARRGSDPRDADAPHDGLPREDGGAELEGLVGVDASRRDAREDRREQARHEDPVDQSPLRRLAFAFAIAAFASASNQPRFLENRSLLQVQQIVVVVSRVEFRIHRRRRVQRIEIPDQPPEAFDLVAGEGSRRGRVLPGSDAPARLRYRGCHDEVPVGRTAFRFLGAVAAIIAAFVDVVIAIVVFVFVAAAAVAVDEAMMRPYRQT